ncbi:MAG: response regulator [Bdellovibrionota bacterium]|jgi:CheY-like chemotaxis protein
MKIFPIFQTLLKKESISIEILLEKLSSIVGLSALETVVRENIDRRLFISAVAERAGIDEKVLVKKLAKKLKLRSVENISGLDFRELTQALSVSELRQYGIMPLANGANIISYACSDPSFVPEIYSKQCENDLILATWGDISRALEASEALSSSDGEESLKKSKRVLRLLIDEASSYGAKDLTLNFDTDSLLYEFMTPDGKLGKGNVDLSMKRSFQNFFNKIIKESCGKFPLEDSLFIKVQSNPHGYRVAFGGVQDFEIEETEGKDIQKNGYVLLFDEDHNFLNVLKRFLERMGLSTKVVTTEDGIRESLASENKPLLVIADFKTTKGDGITLIKNVRDMERNKKIPLLMLTDNEKLEDKVAFLAAGANAYVLKNDSPRILYAQMVRLLQGQEKYSKNITKRGLS